LANHPQSECLHQVWGRSDQRLLVNRAHLTLHEWKRQSDRVVFIAFNWVYTDAVPFQFDLENIISTSKPSIRTSTNRSDDHDPQSRQSKPAAKRPEEDVVAPFVDRRLPMSSQSPIPCRVTARAKFYVPNCKCFRSSDDSRTYLADGTNGDGSDLRQLYATGSVAVRRHGRGVVCAFTGPHNPRP